MDKRSARFTLLEVVVALSLITALGGVIGWRVERFLGHHRFQQNGNQAVQLLREGRAFALSSQSDWCLHWKRGAKGWRSKYYCRSDPLKNRKAPPPIDLGEFEIETNGQKVNELLFEFTSSGAISHRGSLKLRRGDEEKMIQLAPLFYQKEEGTPPPVHPRKGRSDIIPRGA